MILELPSWSTSISHENEVRHESDSDDVTAPGGPEVLQWVDIPEPVLTAPTSIRVRVRAAGVNPIDAKLRARGHLYRISCV